MERRHNWWYPPNYKDDPEWQDDDDWYRGSGRYGDGQESPGWEFVKDRDYDYMLDWARKKYEETAEILASLDRKAEALYRFAATLAGVIFTIIKSMQLDLNFPSILAFVCFLVSVTLCLRVRVPADVATPTTARRAIDSVKHVDDDYIKASMAGSLHCASTGTQVLADWKARQIARASWWLVFGLCWLLFGLLVSKRIQEPQTWRSVPAGASQLVCDEPELLPVERSPSARREFL